MTTVFKMFSGYEFLGGRGSANSIRRAACEELQSNRDAIVVLDFSQVSGVSHSFTDELIAPLSEALGEAMMHRVVACNTAPLVRDTIEAVCEMHRLTPPAFRELCPA